MPNNPPIPLAVGIVAGITGSFILWLSMNDYQRARYFPWIAGAAATAFATAGLLGYRGD